MIMLRVKFALPDCVVFPKGGIDRGVLARIPVLAARLRDDSLFAFNPDKINKVEVKIKGVCKQDMINYLRHHALQHKLETLRKTLLQTVDEPCLMSGYGYHCPDGGVFPHTHSRTFYEKDDGEMLDGIVDTLEDIKLTPGMARLCEFFMDEGTLLWYKKLPESVTVEAWSWIPDLENQIDAYIGRPSDRHGRDYYGQFEGHNFKCHFYRTLGIVKDFVEDQPTLARFIWKNVVNRETLVNLLRVPDRKRKRFLNAEFDHLIPMATGEMQPGNGYLEKQAAIAKARQDPEYVGRKRHIEGLVARNGHYYVGDWIAGDDIEMHPDLVDLEKRLVDKYVKK